jgi:hypothetical protein
LLKIRFAADRSYVQPSGIWSKIDDSAIPGPV